MIPLVVFLLFGGYFSFSHFGKLHLQIMQPALPDLLVSARGRNMTFERINMTFKQIALTFE